MERFDARPMWVLTGISLIGVVLNIYKNSLCFYLWAFSNALWCIVDYQYGLYAQSALFLIYFFLAIWGVLKWRQKEEGIID